MKIALTRRRLGLLLILTMGNLGIWLLTAIFATSEFYRRSIVMGGEAAWNEVLAVQLCTALIWAFFVPFVVLIAERLPLRRPHFVRNAIAIILLLPYLAVLRAALGGIALNLGEHHSIAWSMITLSVTIRTHRDFAFLAVIFFLFNLVDAQRESTKRERQRIRTQTLLARAQLDELNMRVQPQFAVRMLRRIGNVLREAPGAADGSIVALSNILRRTMKRSDDEWIPLADELEQLDRALDLWRANGRFLLAARYIADDALLSCRVPASILQPLVENVQPGQSVIVRCMRDGDDAHLDVTLQCDGTETTSLRIPYQEET